jgi:hypothetical protein
MPCNARIRRPPNREPKSLAAINNTKAIDTIQVSIPDANIDPSLQSYKIEQPPLPPYESNTIDPNYDTYLLNQFEYPLPDHTPDPTPNPILSPLR